MNPAASTAGSAEVNALTALAPARPTGPARPDYVPEAAQEVYIVGLLEMKISSWLGNEASAAPGARVLDAGCGRQPFAKQLRALGYEYTGFDVVQNPEGSVAVLGEIDGILPEALALATFDLIVCFEVLEHVADWQRAFSNFAALLKPGGRLFITCPHFYPLHEEPYDFWRPTPHALRTFATNCGLAVSHLEAAGDAWDVIGTALAACDPAPLGSSLRSRVATRVARRLWREASRAITHGWVRELVQLRGSLYLSNIAIFIKPVG